MKRRAWRVLVARPRRIKAGEVVLKQEQSVSVVRLQLNELEHVGTNYGLATGFWTIPSVGLRFFLGLNLGTF